MKSILVVDDEPDFVETIKSTLKDRYQIIEANDGEEGIRLAASQKPDLVLLDVFLPGMNGRETCRKLKENPLTREIPIIMLTGDASPDARATGIELGADDYIAKPFHSRELLARIDARFRITRKKQGSQTKLGNLLLDPAANQVWVNTREIHLTAVEFRILQYFVEQPNRVIHRKKLLGDLWPDSVVTPRAVDTHIAHLRKKLNGFTCTFETIYGAGYILRSHSKANGKDSS